MLYSYDIFDTIISRKTATPKGIFSKIQYSLQKEKLFDGYPESLKSNFYYARIQAELFARAYLTENEEITLTQIYHVISKNYFISDFQKNALIELELSTEEDNIYGIRENIEKIKNHIQNNDRVVLISDMYLPIEFIRKILIKVDNIFLNIPIYLSSEIGLRKTSGNLYRYVREKEGCKYSNWMHTGDNLYHDILIPKHFGIKTHRYKQKSFLKYETKLIAQHEESALLQSIFGTAKYLRMTSSNPDMALLASLAIPLLYPYVSWVVMQALERKLTDLYFIARDGYVLKIIADSLIHKKNLSIHTHYLYGSREAWRVPKDFDDMFRMYEPNATGLSSIKEFAAKVGVDYLLFKRRLPAKYLKSNVVLSERAFSEVFELIKNDDILRSEFKKKWEYKRQLISSYIIQEINLSSDSFALVDVGGSGVTIDSLETCLTPLTNNKIKVFYLSMTGRKEIINMLDLQERYFWFGFFNFQLLLEAFCRAPHHKCIGYSLDNNLVKPEFESDDSFLSDEYNLYFKMIEEYLKVISTDSVANQQILFNACSNYLSKKPSKEVIKAIGDIPFEYSCSTKEIITFAPKLSLFSAIQECVTQFRKGRNTRTTSPRYSNWRGDPLQFLLGCIRYWYSKLKSR